MPISFQFNKSEKIVVNGQEYHSADEMPENIRRIYMKAVAASADGGAAADRKHTTTKIVFNDKEYPSPDDMPPEIRQAYATIMKSMAAGKKSEAGLPNSIQVKIQRRSFTFPPALPTTEAYEHVWRKWLNIGLAILIAALLLYYFRTH